MSKKAPKLRRNKKADEIERAAEEITDSFYLLVIVGEAFSDISGDQLLDDITRHEAFKDRKLTTKEMLKPSWIDKDDETFYGFWGSAWNKFQDESLNPAMRYLKRWRLVLYDDEDERYREDVDKSKKNTDKCERLEFENKVPKYSKRFFMVTANIDNDPHESAFENREYYEKKGTIKEWQCSKKCLGKKTKVFRPDDQEQFQFGDFRFEVNQQTMLAPSIKYVQRTHTEPLNVDQINTPDGVHNHFDALGDEEDWNFKHPQGFFDFDRHPLGLRPTENALINRPLTKRIADSRSMFFRYFAPSVAPLVESYANSIGIGAGNASGSASARTSASSRSVGLPIDNVERYRPGQKESFRSVYDQSGVLRHFNAESMYSDQISTRSSNRLHHELSYMQTDQDRFLLEKERENIIKRFREEQEEANKKYAPPLDDDLETDNEKNERIKSLQRTLQELEKRRDERLAALKQREHEENVERVRAYHEVLHEAFFMDNVVDQREKGVMSINVVDPLLHHHRYLTEVVDTTDLNKNRVLRGSDFDFVVSLKIRNKASGQIPISYTFGPVKPQIRRKSDIDSTYMDSIIIDIHKYSPDHSRNVIPFEGEVSLIVECLQGKKQFSGSVGHSGKLCRPDLRPWHLFGEYTVKTYKRNKQQEIFGVKRCKHMVDYELTDKSNRYKLMIRTVQYENMKSEIVNVFIDLPISSFKKDEQFDPTKPANFHKPEPKLSLSSRMPRPTTDIPIQSHQPIGEGQVDEEDLRRAQNENHTLPPQHDPTLKPVVNRFLCADCGALARPRVKMGRVDKKWMKTSMAFFKKFSKAVAKDLSEDGDKSLCILELGAGKATRKMADKLLKQTKQYNSTLVRIHPNPPKAKKKVDAEMAEKTVEVLQPVGSALKKINDWVEEMATTLDIYFK
mmetsp:Transcript_10615/g.39582  ORF Transcript_10615/g.39582 Transcript_10615/m.39582 type:complete len:906 (-) Transcript_10615:120-2837(-)|eukprot:CAMPEP_0117446872 /NCGR_PEP_ID=MMETSP0759-20121206/6573_1 /TAXON_ID=63605 /ORGANISM="Percolomonas cosmopolitus, Strain WS" /LENGTH=905 /DNA_ID=CAMNT_0005239169 /DNA_START=290 /DNA_END=3007 /DNA_ORIENTATION=+